MARLLVLAMYVLPPQLVGASLIRGWFEPSPPAESQTVHENRIYSLKITCDEQYPDVSPTLTFISRVNLPFVDQTQGTVDLKKVVSLSRWSRDYTLETILVEIRKWVLSRAMVVLIYQVAN
jgi:ubiquitin-protein ligase